MSKGNSGDTKQGSRAGRKRSPLGKLLLAVVVVVIVLIAAAPFAVSALARPVVESAANNAIAGRVEIDSLSVPVFGSPSASGVRLFDPDDVLVGEFEASFSKGTIGLLLGAASLDLGEITLGGSVDIVRAADGTTNLERAIASASGDAQPDAPPPTDDESTEPIAIPTGANVAFVFDGIGVSFTDVALGEATDAQLATVAIGDLAGSIEFDGGGTLAVVLDAVTRSGADAASLADDGVIDIDIDIAGLVGLDGALTPASASASTLSLKASGRGVRADVDLALDDGLLTSNAPVTASFETAAWTEIVRPLREALQAQPGVTVEQVPSLAIAIDALRVPLALASETADLREASARIALTTGAATGSVDPSQMMEGADAAGGARAFRIDSLSFVLDATDPASGITGSGSTAAFIDGQPAGEVSITLSAPDVLDDDGKPVEVLPEGTTAGLEVAGFATALLQPFVELFVTGLPEAARPRLVEDFGPELSLRTVVTAEAGEPSFDGAVPSASIEFSFSSARASASADLRLAGDELQSGATPISFELNQTTALANRLLADAGIQVSSMPGASVELADVRADLVGLTGEVVDLRALAARLRVKADAITGRATLGEGAAPVAFATEPFELVVDATTLGERTATLAVNSGASAGGAGVVAVDVDFTVSELLDATGAINAPSLLRVRGAAEVTNVEAALLDAVLKPLLGDETTQGMSFASALGQAMSMRLAFSEVENFPRATLIELTADGPRLDVAVPVVYNSRTGRLNSNAPVTLRFDDAGPLLAMFAPRGEGMPEFGALEGGAPIELRLRRTLAQFDPDTFEFQPAGTSLLGELTASGLTVRVPGSIDSPVMLTDARVNVVLPEDRKAPLTLVVNGRVGDARAPRATAQLRVDAEADGLIDRTTLAVTPDAATARATIEVRELRPGQVNVLPAELARIGPNSYPLYQVVAGATGGPLDIVLDLVSPEAGRFTLTGDVTSANVNAKLGARASADAAVLEELSFDATLRTALVNALRSAFAAEGEAGPDVTLTEPGRFAVSLDAPVTLPLGEGFAPDFASADGALGLGATLDLAARVPPMQSGGQRIDPGTVAVRGGKLEASLPLAALAEGKRGTAEVTLSGRVVAVRDGKTGTFDVAASPTLEAGAPVGSFDATADIAGIDLAWLEGLLGQPGLLTDPLGATLTKATLAASMNMDRAESPLESVRLSVDTPRLRTESPLVVGLEGSGDAAGYRLRQPASVRLTAVPAFLNPLLASTDEQGRAVPPAVSVVQPMQVTAQLSRLELPADLAAPFRTGRFQLGASVTVPQLALQTRDGMPITATGITGNIGPGTNGSDLDARFEIVRVSQAAAQASANGNAASGRGTLNAAVRGLTSASGELDTDAVRVSGNFDLSQLPTPIIDAVAQNDLPSAALGAAVSARGSFNDLSATTGRFNVTATAPNGSSYLAGELRGNTLVLQPSPQGQAALRVTQITKALTDRYAEAIPLVETIQKTAQDQAATLILTSPISLPLDGESFDVLNGTLTFDAGTARYSLRKSFFGEQFANPFTKQDEEVGRRLPPLFVTMDRGLVSYAEYKLPLGEFEIPTAGVFNFSTRSFDNGTFRAGPNEQDIAVLIPAALVADDVVKDVTGGVFREAASGLTGALNQLPVAGLFTGFVDTVTTLPIRVRGPIGAAETGVDATLLQPQIDSYFEDIPNKLIGDGLQGLIGGGEREGGNDPARDLIEGILGGGDKDKK
ncbi:MAG: hypothetical protein AAF747_00555 [Planctomycetota bacterium]